MSQVILFDVNETLLDLRSLRHRFDRVFGKAGVMQQWFALLLHSSLVVTLTSAYSDFGTLAGAALAILASQYGVSLADRDRDDILMAMQCLPPHPDVPDNLQRLRAAGVRLATLTNSPRQILVAQMSNSELGGYFEQLISVDQVSRFKPAPETYLMAAGRLGVDIQQVRLVAAHDWDVFGALRAGGLGAYIARAERPYHPLYEQPDVMGADLAQVTDQILQIQV